MKVWRKRVSIGPLDVEEIFLSTTKGMKVSFLTYGGIITGIYVPDKEGTVENVTMSFGDRKDYHENAGYLGAIIGRTAGRIKEGKFTLKEKEYTLSKNYGPNQGHGGPHGFHKKVYTYEIIEEQNQISVKLAFHSKHMEEGYPGEVQGFVTYCLTEAQELLITYEGKSTEDTLLNLTNHCYFNLSGSFEESIKYHELMIAADVFTELDETSAPTGVLLPVENTPFDFRFMREIGEEMAIDHPQLSIAKGYDHGFLFNKKNPVKLRLAHRFSGRVMEVETDDEAVVIYTQNYTQGQILPGGRKLKEGRAIAIEIQRLPIGDKEAFKEHSVLKVGEIYKTYTKFSFFCEEVN